MTRHEQNNGPTDGNGSLNSHSSRKLLDRQSNTGKCRAPVEDAAPILLMATDEGTAITNQSEQVRSHTTACQVRPADDRGRSPTRNLNPEPHRSRDYNHRNCRKQIGGKLKHEHHCANNLDKPNWRIQQETSAGSWDKPETGATVVAGVTSVAVTMPTPRSPVAGATTQRSPPAARPPLATKQPYLEPCRDCGRAYPEVQFQYCRVRCHECLANFRNRRGRY